MVHVPRNDLRPRDDLSNALGGNRKETKDKKQYGRTDSYIKRPAGVSRRPSVLYPSIIIIYIFKIKV